MFIAGKTVIRWATTAALSIGAVVGMVGCDEQGGDESESSSAAVATDNGLSGVNGLYGVNGITGVNGLYGVNGIMGVNGISGVNGLYGSTASAPDRPDDEDDGPAHGPVHRLVRARFLADPQQAGPVRQTLQLHGIDGPRANWLNGGISATDEMNVSACLISRINSAGMHVPLWMVGATTQIGWGYDPGYPAQEGSYFGNVMRAGSDGSLHAYYCNGRDYSKALVPGRLGADDTSTSTRTRSARVRSATAIAPSTPPPSPTAPAVVDGYSSCNGISNPITVWRKASYNPVFDDNYIYKLVSASSHLALDVYNWGTGENTPVVQYTSYDQANQRFRIIQVASSEWKIIDMNSGKALTNRNGAIANVQINSYSGASTDNWALDDHNGHFIIRNKATNAYLHSPGSGLAAAVTQTSYNGNADTDWDLVAVDSL